MGRKISFNRQKALESAMESFWRQGYESTSMRELSIQLGMRPGSVYNAFGPKEKLFEDALRLYAEKHLGPKLAAMKDNPDPVDALCKAMESIVDECATPAKSFGCFIINSLPEISKINSGVTALLHEMIRRKEEAFSACITRAQKMGRINPSYDAEELARLLVALQFSMRAMGKIGLPPDCINEVQACALKILKTS